MHPKSYVNKDHLDVHVISRKDELDAVYQTWDNQGNNPIEPTQQLPWIKACLETFAPDSVISFIHVQRNNQTLAIAPLCKERGLLKVFEMPGVRQLLEPSDFIYSDPKTLDVVAAKLAEFKMPLSLYRLPGDSVVPTAVKHAYRRKAKIITRDYKRYPFIDLTGSNIQEILPGRLRQDIRRGRRKADKLGKVAFEVHRPQGKNDFLPMFQELLGVEAASWKGRIGTALIHDNIRRRFYEDYGIRASELGIMRMSFMRINDLAVAAQLAVESGQRFWLLKVGYHEDFASCSPGMQLINETLLYASEKGLLSYEFLGTVDHWTKRWTQKERNSLIIAVYPYTIAGLLAFIGDASRFVRIKIMKRLNNI